MIFKAADRRDVVLSALYFFGSTVITWWFIVGGADLYTDRDKMILSCSIAGAKWTVQILAALILLDDQRWPFIRRIGATCMTGSVILLPFCFTAMREWAGLQGFLYSLLASVLVMIALYYINVRRSQLKMSWFWGWIGCLAVAIMLQLTVVFHAL